MATFSTNQTRHLYVVDPKHTVEVGSTPDKSGVYFKYVGAAGPTRSDLIDVKNIISVKATKAAAFERKLTQYVISLDKDINGGNPVAGQDYILRIIFKQFVGISDADQYFKYGMVHAYSELKTASEFYEKLAESLTKNFSRETTELVTIALVGEKGSYTGVSITEVEQPWKLGKISSGPVFFEVQPTTITYEGDEVIWGKVTTGESGTSILNGKNIADLEYFCMGERGDVYRGAGYPHNLDTEYLVDPTKGYHVLDIHYAYVGDNESVQKSEKTITIVCETAATINTIINSLKTATGLTIDSVS